MLLDVTGIREFTMSFILGKKQADTPARSARSGMPTEGALKKKVAAGRDEV